MAAFIRILKWREFQHYNDRSPPWIKLHRDLLSSRTWVGVSNETRVLAIACMLLAAATDNLTPLDRAHIRRVAYLDFDLDFGPLLDKQFLEFVDEDGKVLARCSRDASKVLSREETTTEAETPLSTTGTSTPTNPTSPPETPAPKRARRGSKVALPDGFGISARVQAWAAGKGFGRLDEHLEAFRAKALKSDLRYVDWDAAFEEAIREDWAGLRGKNGNHASGAPASAWKVGAEPDRVLRAAAEMLEIPPWGEGETQGQFRKRIVDAGGEALLRGRG